MSSPTKQIKFACGHVGTSAEAKSAEGSSTILRRQVQTQKQNTKPGWFKRTFSLKTPTTPPQEYQMYSIYCDKCYNNLSSKEKEVYHLMLDQTLQYNPHLTPNPPTPTPSTPTSPAPTPSKRQKCAPQAQGTTETLQAVHLGLDHTAKWLQLAQEKALRLSTIQPDTNIVQTFEDWVQAQRDIDFKAGLWARFHRENDHGIPPSGPLSCRLCNIKAGRMSYSSRQPNPTLPGETSPQLTRSDAVRANSRDRPRWGSNGQRLELTIQQPNNLPALPTASPEPTPRTPTREDFHPGVMQEASLPTPVTPKREDFHPGVMREAFDEALEQHEAGLARQRAAMRRARGENPESPQSPTVPERERPRAPRASRIPRWNWRRTGRNAGSRPQWAASIQLSRPPGGPSGLPRPSPRASLTAVPASARTQATPHQLSTPSRPPGGPSRNGRGQERGL